MEAGQYNYLPTFVNGLVALLGAIHTMGVFSQKDEVATTAEAMAELAQALALVHTAQAELAQKADRLESVEELADSIEASHDEIATWKEQTTAELKGFKERAEKELEAIAAHTENAAAELAAAKESADEVESLSDEISKLVEENKRTRDALAALTKSAEQIREKNESQQQLIASLLPKGASAGLAAAFASLSRFLCN